jgi:hypothetical protein
MVKDPTTSRVATEASSSLNTGKEDTSSPSKAMAMVNMISKASSKVTANSSTDSNNRSTNNSRSMDSSRSTDSKVHLKRVASNSEFVSSTTS